MTKIVMMLALALCTFASQAQGCPPEMGVKVVPVAGVVKPVKVTKIERVQGKVAKAQVRKAVFVIAEDDMSAPIAVDGNTQVRRFGQTN